MKVHARSSALYGIVALCSVAVLVLADQITKAMAVAGLKGQEDLILLRGVLQLQYLENRGAAFGVLQNSRLFFIIVATIAVAGLTWVFFKIPRERAASGRSYLPLQICLIMLISGAIGNLIDRLQLSYVRDFIYFSLIDFPIFNVADIYVTVSVFLLVILLFFYYSEEDLQFTDRRAK